MAVGAFGNFRQLSQLMSATQKAFSSQVQAFKVALDQDTLEYINGILEDLNDIDSVREATEQFLQDAIDDQEVIDRFYGTLKIDSTTASSQAEAVTLKKPLRIDETSKDLDSLSLDSPSKVGTKVYLSRDFDEVMILH
jgi:hypothetical protein